MYLKKQNKSNNDKVYNKVPNPAVRTGFSLEEKKLMLPPHS